MSRLYLFFCSFLIISIWQHSCNAIPIMAPWLILKQAKPLVKFIETYATRYQLVKAFISEPDDNTPRIFKKLDKISTDISLLKNAFLSALSNRIRDKLTQRTDTLFTHMKHIERLYRTFLDIVKNYDKYNRNELIDFINIVTTNSIVELKTIIEEMHEDLVDLDVKGESILTMIAKKSWTTGIICKQGKSPQMIIQDLYQQVAQAHMKGFIIRTYAYRLKQDFENKSYVYRRKEILQYFTDMIQSTGEKVKQALKTCSRDLYLCALEDGKRHIEGITYWKLDPVFQGYFLYEKDIHNNSIYTAVYRDCSSFTDVRLKCISNFCVVQKPEKLCSGRLRDCTYVDSSMQVCHSNLSSHRRYEWMTTESGVQYGHKEMAYCEDLQGLYDRLVGLASVCLCNCESELQKSARYFSLLPAISEVNRNYVIVSAQLVLERYVVYIKIEQAKLNANGTLNKDVEYKTIKKVSVEKLFTNRTSRRFHIPSETLGYSGWTEFYENDNVYAVTYKQKTVFLDDLRAPPGHVVTGMKFQQVDDNLRFKIRVTPFDYASGRMNRSRSRWIYENNDLEHRTELDLGDPDDPIRATKVDAISNHNQYVQFRMSGFKEDLGQNTVPFLNAQKTIPSILLPITGVGLAHEGTKGSGGFLTLKLQHYDLSDYFD